MARRGGGCFKIGIGLILIPVILVGVALFIPNLVRVLTHETIEGRVIDLIPSVDSDGDTVYAPVYEYEVDGRSYRYQSQVSLGGLLVPDLGDEKTLLYNPNDPDDARVRNLFLLIVLPGLLVGVALSIFMALILGTARRAWQRRHGEAWPNLEAMPQQWETPDEPIEHQRETITATFMGTEASPMDAGGKVRYRIRARAEINGATYRFHSEWLDGDPTLDLMQLGNQVEVRIDPGDPGVYEVVVPQ